MKTLCLLLAVGSLMANDAPVADPPRAEKPAFKGMELYSWKDAETGEWRFSLLRGTNREKKAAEMMDAKTQIKSLDDLKKCLSALAVGENVAWNLHVDDRVFALPDQKTVEEIKKLSESRKLKLSLPGKKRAGQKSGKPDSMDFLESDGGFHF